MARGLRVSRLKALSMEALAGEFEWAGFNADFTEHTNYIMVANRGVYQWAGRNANLTRQSYRLEALRGQFNMTGFTSELTYAGSLPTWSATVPAKQFTFGTPETFSLVPYTTGFNSLLHRFEVLTGTLPTGVTVTPTTGLSYSGAGSAGSTASISYRIADIGTGVAADWTARSTATGVFFKENFNYTNLAQAANHTANPCFFGAAPGTGATSPDPTIFQIRDDNKLSGRSLRINFPANSGQASRTWLYTFAPNLGAQVPTNGTQYQTFYFQIILRGDTHADFPFKDSGSAGFGAMATPKYFNIDRHDGSTNVGEVVCTNLGMQGKVTLYRLADATSQGPSPVGGRDFATLANARSTPNTSADYQYQGGVDESGTTTTMTQYRQRYGHFHSDLISTPIGSVTGASTMAGLGVPRSDESGLNWNPSGAEKRLVIEVFIDRPGDRIRMWGNVYGQAPKLIGDSALDDFDGHANRGLILNRDAQGNTGSGPAGTNTGYPGFQLTLFLTDNQNAAGSDQPTTWADYIEIIASTNPINFPGGLALPGV